MGSMRRQTRLGGCPFLAGRSLTLQEKRPGEIAERAAVLAGFNFARKGVFIVANSCQRTPVAW